MQKHKLSYMQMQEWITTTYLMARARVSRPERDYPYLGFARHHLMETLVATLSSATPSVQVELLRSLSSQILENSYVGYSSSRSVGYTPWFPPEFKDSPQIRWGYSWMGYMASPTLSRIPSGWNFWSVSIVHPSVWNQISPSAHWCWVGLLQLLCVWS